MGYICYNFCNCRSLNSNILFFLWFAIGAGAAAITSLFIASVSWNLAIFLVVSFTLWISTRKLVKNLYKKSTDLKTFQDQIVGMKGKIIKINENGEKYW